LAVICIVGVLVVLSCIVLFLKIPFLQISEIDIVGAEAGSVPRMVENVKEQLKGEYIGLIPRSNIFLYPKKGITKALISDFKNIESLSISRKGLSTIAVVVSERTKAALVCEGFHEDDSSGSDSCFFSDNDGYVFAKASASSSDSFVRYYIVTDKGDALLGTNFIDSINFKEIAGFVAGSAKAGIVPLGVLVSEGNQYEMYVKNNDSEITVYFDTRSPLSATLSNFVAFWNNTFNASAGKKSTTTPTIDYINLRYGNTIFYSAQ
jgi:hypothetical protein